MMHRISSGALLLALLVPGPTLAQDECEATLSTSYRGQTAVPDTDYVDHVFAVEVRADARCAKVDYILRVVEENQEGEKTEKVKSFNQRVRDGEAIARRVTYRLARSTLVIDYEFKVTGCTPCAAP
jgi:hypothetical protein